MKKIKLYSLITVFAIGAFYTSDFWKNGNESLGDELFNETKDITKSTSTTDADSWNINNDDKLLRQKYSDNTHEQLLQRTGYIVSYNKDTKLPNWVA